MFMKFWIGGIGGAIAGSGNPLAPANGRFRLNKREHA